MVETLREIKERPPLAIREKNRTPPLKAIQPLRSRQSLRVLLSPSLLLHKIGEKERKYPQTKHIYLSICIHI